MLPVIYSKKETLGSQHSHTIHANVSEENHVCSGTFQTIKREYSQEKKVHDGDNCGKC